MIKATLKAQERRSNRRGTLDPFDFNISVLSISGDNWCCLTDEARLAI